VGATAHQSRPSGPDPEAHLALVARPETEGGLRSKDARKRHSELDQLTSELSSGEEVICLALAEWTNPPGPLAESWWSGVLALTTKRLMYVHRRKRLRREIPLPEIAAITGTAKHGLTVASRGRNVGMRFGLVRPARRTKQIVDYVREGRGGTV
jgi:hypothetical protein